MDRPGPAAAGTAWAKEFGAQFRAMGTGDVYLNLVTDDEDVDRVAAFWSDERLAPAGSGQGDYDPENVFRFNHNITPGTG